MPEITFHCGACKKLLKVKDTLAGKKIRCPQCTAVVPVPVLGPAAPQVALPVPSAAPAHQSSGFPFENEAVAAPPKPSMLEHHADDISPPPRRKAKPRPTKKRGFFVPFLAFLLASAYVAGVVMVYLDMVPQLKAPDPVKMPEKSNASGDKPTP